MDVIEWFLHENRRGKIESRVADALLTASAIPNGAGTYEMLASLSLARNELGEEFSMCQKQVLAGMPLEEAFLQMKKRTGSETLSNALDLLFAGINAGGDSATVLRKAAEDMLETNSFIQMKSASAVVNKYTILVAGGLIVPIIIGLLAGSFSAFDFSMLEEIGFSAGTESALISEYSEIATLIYIAEYALIASVFVALQGGKRQNAIFYALALVPCGVAAFFAGKMFA